MAAGLYNEPCSRWRMVAVVMVVADGSKQLLAFDLRVVLYASWVLLELEGIGFRAAKRLFRWLKPVVLRWVYANKWVTAEDAEIDKRDKGLVVLEFIEV
ncbi:hypothetical protein C5167_004351 [Papaver somniferum]|uniref:Uncharacterized protein n=1 Tax=Papaver somniferum TaxID=3469 RepID=A0A4Y7JB77_PAPSO|nr:hypothetical protein C5167_004351 [Papaver somniferum]